jgi:hypothetical protein
MCLQQNRSLLLGALVRTVHHTILFADFQLSQNMAILWSGGTKGVGCKIRPGCYILPGAAIAARGRSSIRQFMIYG